MKIDKLFCLLLLICSCKQNKSKEVNAISNTYNLKSSLNIFIKNDTVYLNNLKYSGFLYELHANKDTVLLESYTDGLKNGIEIKWYSNKKLMEIRGYNDGKKNGKQTAFWQNGKKKFEFFAKDDAYQGELKEWNMDGKLIHLANYKNGQEEGAQKLWYDNGKIRANYVIINGKRYGLLGTKNCRNVSDSIFNIK
ncbi:toxin-antitoxin system YwqK family antitoxin [Pedobacter jejuensis]|uniref:Toxin-antitoxin system YwqK family antitoxin n=1 Tax=Pedobacter jejuensis TaxID=1268550 RepID=A0A3N0C0F7_9SPHI|nr:toxin-antitoxin system YwqK family antitoxin [Pedobacter jejuensis]RNL55510.1 toxin-antitoxin system YwqK family antitoxin [Pedobacter jejuensis]